MFLSNSKRSVFSGHPVQNK